MIQITQGGRFMKKAIYNAALCKECRLCVKPCPKDAIIPTDILNSKGYKTIKS